MTRPTWTPDRIKILTKMWEAGSSAGEVADALGFGITRHAVIGKANRLGLRPHDAPASLKKKGPRPAPVQRLSMPAYGVAPVALLDAGPGQCRFMFDEPRHTCCGQPVAYGPYCIDHALRCYQTNPFKQESA